MTLTSNMSGYIVGKNTKGQIARAVVVVDHNGNELTDDFLLRVKMGQIDGYRIIDKFGHNHAVGTSIYTPVCAGAVFNTPQISGAKALRVRAGDEDDTDGGSGAWAIQMWGCDTAGLDVDYTVRTAGTSASALTSGTLHRITRAKVIESGTYATSLLGSHAAPIIIEDSAGNEWATIPFDDFPFAQSQIGVVTIPTGETAYMLSSLLTIDSSKTVNMLLFEREGILQTVAPYKGMHSIQEFPGISGRFPVPLKSPLGPFPANTDVGYMAKANSQAAAVSVDFSMLYIAD